MAHVTSNTLLVWFERREFVRFGTPINLHDTVDLTVGDDHVWASEWEPAVGAPLRLRAGRHDPGTPVRNVRVRVDQLWEARAQLEPSPRGGWRVPPHGGQIIPVTRMDFTAPDGTSDTDGLATPESVIQIFAGWIVQATVLADLPPREHGWPYGIEPPIDLTGIGPSPPRVADWAPELDANPNATIEPTNGWTMRTPFFAAVQHDNWHPSDSEFAQGHPCIVDRGSCQHHLRHRGLVHVTPRHAPHHGFRRHRTLRAPHR